MKNQNEKSESSYSDTKLNLERKSWWESTYVFKYYNNETKSYREYFDIIPGNDESLARAKNQKEYFEYILFTSPYIPPDEFRVDYQNWIHNLSSKYFPDIFDIQLYKERYIDLCYFRIILPKTLYEEICKFLEKYDMLPIKDLILHIIARGQQYFTEK
ncbi:MAG: hypothetical protein IPG12_03150 [Saprospiraceae bacterium]|nr:hypothetical protein [Saprospiraceae bacterium]